MGLSMRCDVVDRLPENLNTDICGISAVKWRLSVCLAIGLLGVGIYLLQKWKYRCHKTLLTFHNLRAAVALLLLIINTLELARALLPNRQKDAHEAALLATDHVAVFIGAGLLWNALAALLLTFVLMWYHRMVELKKAVAYLHVSAVVAALMFLVRIFELAEVVYYENVYELEPCLQGSTALCFLGLSVLDGFTIYKERYRPDYLEDYEKIGYKHTLATFYSKAVFWWLTPLLWFGYKEPLELEDLGQMRLEDSARAHYDQFLLIYKTAKVKNGDRPPSLWLCYLKSSWRMFTLGGVLKLCGDLFALIGPLAIQQIVQYIESMYAAAHATWPQTNRNNNSGGSSFSHDYNGSSNVGGGVGGDNNNHSSITRWAFQNLYDNSNSNNYNNNNNNKTGSNKSLSSIGFNGANHIGLLAAAATNWISNVVGGLPRTADTSDISSDNNNQIAAAAAAANGIDYNGTEVKIYYASWLDLVSNGWAVAWIVLLAALAQGALSQASTHILNMTGIRIKTSLQGLIYRKTLLLNSSVGQAGDNDNDDGQAAVRAGAARVGGKGVAGKNGEAGERLNENNTSAQKTAQQQRQPPQPPQQPQKRQKDQQKNASALSDVGAITNLMSEDALNVMSFFWIVHYVWSIPLKIAVVMYLLYLKLGVSAIIGSFACILIMTPLQFLIGKAMSTNTERVALRLRWRRAAYCLWRLCLLRAAFTTFFVKFTDERLQTIHYTLMGIKIIKLNVWTDIFIKRIRDVREKELKYLGLDSFYWTLMTILTHISSVLITFITLAAYVRLENDRLEFTASRLFSALALFQQLTVPLLIFPITVPIILSAIVSTRRLERFLGAREIHKQFEGIRHMARILSKSDASLDYYEIKGQSKSMAPAPRTVLPPINCEHKQNERPTLKLHLPESPAPLAQSEPQTPLSQLPPETAKTGVNDNAAEKPAPPCVCDNEGLLQHYESRAKQLSQHRRELLRNSPYVVIRPRKFPNAHVQLLSATQQMLDKKLDSWRRDSLLLKMPEDMAVSVRDACFVWNPQRFEEPLSVKNVTIPKGRLTVIVGENGSGKTSFLSALLMEMPLISGDIIWNKTSTIAFVPQQPWLLNASIRENILFGEPFRPRRYDFVLEACALKPDIELMPDADFTVIGERGINLSGGQRQRVAIARALYSSANVVIMDDPLSSLDNEVSRHIFEQSIKRMLLKVNRTVILVTQQLQLTQHADYLIVMKDRHLQASGSYKEIELRQPHIVAKWNAIIAKAHEKEQASQATALARTAQERWKLYKNVTKMGLQRSASTMRRKSSAGSDTAADGFQRGGALTTATSTVAAADSVDDAAASVVGRLAEEDEDEEDDVDETDDLLPVSLPSVGKNIGERRSMSGSLRSVGSFRSSIYGSRHLFYDAPLPIDECQTEDVIMRRRSNRHRRAATQRRRQQQQQRPLSIASTASSRLSGVSSDASECRRSFFTGSCSSGNSYGSYQSGVSADSRHSTVSADSECEPQRLRVHTWQPQSATAVGALAQHQPVARNASSPGRLPSQTAAQQPAEARTSDAALVAELVQSNANKSPDAVSGFQQFLRRMSMRRSAVHRRHRTSSARNSIVSITEETTPVTTPTSTSLPSIELSAVPSAGVVAAEGEAESTTTTETDSWIVNIENEESVPDQVHIDYKMLTNMMRAGKQSTVTMNADAGAADVQRGRRAVRGLGVGLPDTAIKTPAVASQQQQQQQLPGYDAERKYGKIPMQIYLLYLRASGWPIVLLFCVTALIWQGMRVYTDVWLQHWTDGNDNAAASATATFMGSVNDTYGSTSMPLPTAADAHYNNSNNGHEQHRIVAATDVTYYFRIYAAISCVCIVMAVLSTPAGQMAGCNARRHLHDKLLLSIMRRSLHFFQVTPLGRLMNRFGNDMAIIDKKIAATSQRLLQFTLLCLCAVLINVSITPWFMLLTVPICAAYYIIQKFYRSSARELQRIENATNSPVISHLAETIQGVTTIRAYNQETRFTEILFKRLEANTIAFTILNTSNRWLGISLDFLGGVIVFVAIVTALLAATISCSNYQQELHDKHANTSTDTNSNSSSQSHTYGDNQRTASAELTPTPSLVGLAINYTLLMPIYLNWVVKLLADMEMYVGSVERIAHYAEMDADAAADMTAAADAEMQAVIVKDAAGNSGEGDVAVAPLTAAAAGDDVKEPLTAVRCQLTAGNDQPVVARAAGKSTRSTCMPWVHSDVQRINFCHHHQPVPISWPKRGDITFENVSLRYEGQMEHVIKNLTLKIPYGQKIGVCGRTGSGKSSLALSLFGVLQATSGRIIIDDVDITKIHPDEMCSRLSIIPQDAYLFNTIRENLDPTCFYAMPELQRCLDMVGLLDVVYAQPESIDAAIGEGGGLQLNAGQRQMLCLARAIMRGSVCLIMDEATSSLDAGAEKTLMAAAHNAFKGRTIITIAHRLSTILDYDRIIVLENGRIIEDDSPQQLLQRSEGAFYALLNSGRMFGATTGVGAGPVVGVLTDLPEREAAPAAAAAASSRK